jgi:hypothetical protein
VPGLCLLYAGIVKKKWAIRGSFLRAPFTHDTLLSSKLPNQ